MAKKQDFLFIKNKIYRKVFSEWIETLDSLRSESGVIPEAQQGLINQLNKTFVKDLRAVPKMYKRISSVIRTEVKQGLRGKNDDVYSFMHEFGISLDKDESNPDESENDDASDEVEEDHTDAGADPI